MKLLHSFVRDTSAATALEYALIIAGIAILGLAAIPLVGVKINTVFGKAGTALGS